MKLEKLLANKVSKFSIYKINSTVDFLEKITIFNES